MLKVFATLLAFFLVNLALGSRRPCIMPHSVFKECGSACPPTCDDPNPQFCTEQCVMGCFCKDGYVLNNSGNCILPTGCPNSSSCPYEHMEYTTCGTACPPSCKNPQPTFCTLQCVEGCFCQQGYLLHSNGSCVLKNQC